MVAQAYTDVTSQMRGGLDKIKDPIARILSPYCSHDHAECHDTRRVVRGGS
jgi:hypothetical protein